MRNSADTQEEHNPAADCNRQARLGSRPVRAEDNPERRSLVADKDTPAAVAAGKGSRVAVADKPEERRSLAAAVADSRRRVRVELQVFPAGERNRVRERSAVRNLEVQFQRVQVVPVVSVKQGRLLWPSSRLRTSCT